MPSAELGEGKELSFSDSAFEELAERLQARRGLDVRSYKDRYIRRRIAVRLRAQRCSSLENYLQVLEQKPGEWDLLAAALTINVSNFFRNPETFELIRTRLLPLAVQWRKQRGEPRLRLWSAGCSEGDEAFSLAILLREHFPGPVAAMSVSILGTDVDEDSLRVARAGSYPESRLADLPSGLREKYFRRQGEFWTIRPRVASLVEFRRQDLLQEAGSEDLDLILCRNVLIYLSREEQERILAGFYRSLRPEGFLVLGKTETLVGRMRRALITMVPRERIYQKPPSGGERARQEVLG